VGDGREAVQRARDTRPDVVIMDLSMPELNGADAAARSSSAIRAAA
jgi:response regulator NasT